MLRSSSRRVARRFTATTAVTALAAAALSVAAPAQAADEVTGTVTDTAGVGISGRISVYRESSGSYYYYSESDVDSGRIAVSVPAGNYKFSFRPEDSLLQSEFYLDKADLSSADAVSVAPTATLSTWVIEPRPLATGRVINAAGQPLVGVNVNSYDADYDTVGFASTKKDGTFAVPVEAGGSKVQIYPYQDGSKIYVGEWYNDKPDFASADLVAGALGDVTLTRGGQITGSVTSDAGAPLRAIEVCSDRANYCDKTNAAGAYTIEGVYPGEQTVTFRDRSGEYLTEYYNNVPVAGGGDPTPVAVAKDQVVALGATNLTPNPTAPTGVDFTGKVVDDTGAPVPGIEVKAHSVTPDEDDSETVDTAVTRQDGTYHLTRSDGIAGQPALKLEAAGFSVERNDDTYLFGHSGQWSGNVKTYEHATAVAVTPGAAVTQDFTLERRGAVSGAITSASNLPMAFRSVQLVRVDTVKEWLYGASQAELDGTFENRNITPGEYLVSFSGADHVGQWWKNQTLRDKAKTITVKPGATVSGLNAALSNAVKAVERPSLSGFPWVGKQLTVDTGVWNARGSFTATWLVNKKPVHTGLTYTPTKEDLGKKLVVSVLNEVGKLSGTATTTGSVKVGYQPKVKVKGKGGALKVTVKAKKVKAKKIKGTLVAQELVKIKANGKPKYKKVGKAKVKKGKATIRLNLKGKGKHTVVFTFKGKGKVGSTEFTKKFKR